MKKIKVPLNEKKQLFIAAFVFAERAGFEPIDIDRYR